MTLEEKVAELESEVDSLTGTTPTDYYTSRYSGEEMDAAIAAALSGYAPAGTYSDLAALAAAIPEGNENVYLTTDNNKWNYWNGTAWTPGGTYTGAASSVEVGTVTTGDPGTEASVTNSGTDTAAVLDFVIPRGADGTQGEPGEAGPQGPPGADGTDGTSFTVLALYATLTDLQTAHPVGDPGDAYAVGTSADNVIYIWDTDTSAWTSIGAIQGPQGVPGETGPEGPVGEAGPQGPTGETGAQGETGPAGQSAYESAQAGGYTGTESEFNASLVAVEGKADKVASAKEAVANWKKKCERWQSYCDHEEIKKPVRPVLVIQVEDGNEREITQTDLDSCISILEDAIGRRLQAGEVVHTFDKHETIKRHGLDIRRVDASRIEEDEKAIVVFFKMNLSTGWDCPRAETMMSFRHANDYTYIAQLLGRMIRTPLARRVESDAELNNVGLFLPFFDEKTVKMVEQALRDSEAIVPAETGSHKELITLKRDPAFADVFSDMNLITYRIDSARKQPALRRLIALARALTQDMIAPEARKSTLKKVLDEFESEIAELKKSGKFEEISKAVTGLALRTLTIDYGSSAEGTTDNISEIVELSEFDINNLFERAGKVLGEGLHKEYWVRHAVRDFKDVKTEIIVLTNDNAAMERLESFADKLFNELYDMNKTAFRKLKEDRRDAYKKLALSSTTPIALDWELPPTIDFLIGEDAVILEKHLYIPSDGGEFKVSLNDWELGVIREEMKDEKGAVAWLRNLDRKRWSLEIPYEVDGVVTSMFPDLIVVRADAHGYVFDVLEPHDSSRKDNYPKAVGLAKFAEKHGEHFGRIQLIRKVKGADKRDHFYRLDMGKLSVRNRVRGVTSNAELDRIFNEDAQTEE